MVKPTAAPRRPASGQAVIPDEGLSGLDCLGMASATPSEWFDCLGSQTRILVDGDATGGRFDLLESVEPPGSMPPLHVHHAQEDGVYVIEGTVTLLMPGTSVECGPGDFFLAPRGVPHAYRVGDVPLHWLAMSSPAGFARFVLELAALPSTDPEELDPEELAVIAAKHGLELLGPPGALP
jgi:mannose-6-phosphate isomerase-like protein (cupin superfamily)